MWAFLVHEYPLRRACLLMTAFAALFTLSFTPYLPDGLPAIMANVFAYSGSLKGVYGLAALIPARSVTLLGFAVMLPLPLVLRRRPLADTLAAAALGTLVFMPAFGVNYFLYALALLTLVSVRAAAVLGALTSVYALATWGTAVIGHHWLLTTVELLSYPVLWGAAALLFVYLCAGNPYTSRAFPPFADSCAD